MAVGGNKMSVARASLLLVAALFVARPAGADELVIKGKAGPGVGPFRASVASSGKDDICDILSSGAETAPGCSGLDLKGLRAIEKQLADLNRDRDVSQIAHAIVRHDVWGLYVIAVQQQIDTTTPVDRARIASLLAASEKNFRADSGGTATSSDRVITESPPSGYVDFEVAEGADLNFTRLYVTFGAGAAYVLFFSGPVARRTEVIAAADVTVASINVAPPVPTAEGKSRAWWTAFFPLVLIAWGLYQRAVRKRQQARAEHLARPQESVTDVNERRKRRRRRRAAEREETEASDADGAS